ncbi:hypothetical protein D082_01360 [Synechocystis sp. PCC 6714]|nr:hypothetical protein D082_01360 [Synechocystis sp. PCC 6714]
MPWVAAVKTTVLLASIYQICRQKTKRVLNPVLQEGSNFLDIYADLTRRKYLEEFLLSNFYFQGNIVRQD